MEPQIDNVAAIVDTNGLISRNKNLIRVLHVDDETAFLETLKSIFLLEAYFLAVDGTSSVREAFKKLENHVYDVIVSARVPYKDCA